MVYTIRTRLLRRCQLGPPEYCIPIASIPIVVGVAFYLLALKWYEAVAVIVLAPIIIACMI